MKKSRNTLRRTINTASAVILMLLAASCSKQDNAFFTPSEPTQDQSTAQKPTETYYKMLALGNFVYYNQFTSGTTSTNQNYGCLAAASLMGAHLMNTSIAVNVTKFAAYCSGMGVTTSGALITSAYNYLHNNVFTGNLANVVNPNTTTGKSNTISTIKTYLTSNRPVVALVRYKVGTSKIVSPSGVLNHFVLIVGLSESSAGVGTVYYFDSNNNNTASGAPQSCSWATFLSAMSASSSYGNYNFMRIGN